MTPKYEEDFYGWVTGNIAFLKQKRFDEMDIEHLIEELEDMGNNKKHALISRLAQLIFHLLKWQYQPDFRGRSWEGSIKMQRMELEELLQDSPSLKSKVTEGFSVAYKKAQLIIQKETPIDLKLMPQICPYTFEQCLDDEFYPD
ncbi:DUF29 domain-containing protein [Candidatus Finniella inopinata]|uniref:DUF29 domain-containing protein n=1 Tax=Candidatus Finniella inopinata TaxID=1696036 RepID=A0A4Q7DIR5_9PROT|nr:DUF29 domain-containing protein [Candidatus Finniella inopinata]RZI45884.1 DUF29 domain-containing protein [Candidatus Finniella inopinata]